MSGEHGGYFAGEVGPARPPEPPPRPAPAAGWSSAGTALPWLLGAAGLALVAGALLPWVSVAGTTANGWAVRFGVVPSLAGLVCLGVAAGLVRAGQRAASPGRGVSWTVVVLGLLAALNVAYVLVKLRQVASSLRVPSFGGSSLGGALHDLATSLAGTITPRPAPGLWVSLAGAVLAVAGGVLALPRGRIR